MAGVYVAVGHGTKPGGTYDPGAIGSDGREEHEEAHEVVAACAKALNRSSVQFVAEADAGNSHDPNFAGSVAAVNAGNFEAAVEIHFDWLGAPRGGFGLYLSNRSRLFADAIRTRWAQSGLPTRTNTYRNNLSFLKAECPAVIWECDRVFGYSLAVNEKMGEAIAAGICDWLGVPFVSTIAVPTPQSPPPPKPDDEEEDMGLGLPLKDDESEWVAKVGGTPGDVIWVTAISEQKHPDTGLILPLPAVGKLIIETCDGAHVRDVAFNSNPETRRIEERMTLDDNYPAGCYRVVAQAPEGHRIALWFDRKRKV